MMQRYWLSVCSTSRHANVSQLPWGK